MGAYVGLDVHAKFCFYVAQDEEGRELGRGEVPTSRDGMIAIQRILELPDGTPVALETGTVSFFVARQLAAVGFRPVVVDASEVRKKAWRPTQKADSRDALELCEGLRRGIYRTIVHVPTRDISLLREILSRRRHFVRLASAEINASKRILRANGLGSVPFRVHAEVSWDRLFQKLAGHDEVLSFLRRHRSAWAELHRHAEELEEELAIAAAPFEKQCRLLQTVPGVGPIIALTTIAAFADVQRFPSAKHAASFAGIVPTTHQSGERSLHGHITHRGSPELRAMLCEAAQNAARPNHPLNPFFRRIAVGSGSKRAVTAVAHRLCRILFSMLRHERPFDPARLGIEMGPFVHTSTRLYRLRPAPRSPHVK